MWMRIGRARLAAFAILLMSVSVPQFATAQDEEPLDEVLAAVEFRAVAEIVIGDLAVSSFANNGTASLPIETTVPVACSVVYGVTPEFGSLAVDLDMNGGTHSNHNPLLTHLEPETTYYFRVQGVDDFGVIYVSPVMTFTTPARTEVAVTNLASPDLGAEITGFSSAFGGAAPSATWGVLSAVDGSQNTAWSSAGDGDDAWIEIRLAQPSQIDRIEYWSRAMGDGSSRVLDFIVTTEDGTVHGPFKVPDASQTYSFDVDFVTATLRFDVVSSTGGNTGAVEFGVYGLPLTGD